GRQQRGGLALDPSEVLLHRGPVAIARLVLGQLAAADPHHRTGDDGHHGGLLGECRLLVGLGEVVVADHDRRLVPEGGGNRRQTAPQRRLVDHVVVHQGGGVDELHGHRRVVVRRLEPPEPAGQQDQGRPESLAAGGEEGAHRTGHRRPVVVGDRGPDPELDVVEVLRHGGEETGVYRPSQRSTSCTSGTSWPKRIAATWWKRRGTAVTTSSWLGVASVGASIPACRSWRLTLSAVGRAESMTVNASG